MSSSEIDFLDVGVWIALNVPTHADHERANRYWSEEAKPYVALCRTSALGFVRLLCQKTGEAVTPLTLDQAWKAYLEVRAKRHVVFLEEPQVIEDALANLIGPSTVPARLWTDAYLAAFAISAGLRLVTFDKDFERFPGLDLLRL